MASNIIKRLVNYCGTATCRSFALYTVIIWPSEVHRRSMAASLWKHVPYIRPSRRYDPDMRQLQEDTVSVHKRQAARGRRHCPGCGAFMARASQAVRCAPCAEREQEGDSDHWWTGLRGREKRLPRP